MTDSTGTPVIASENVVYSLSYGRSDRAACPICGGPRYVVLDPRHACSRNHKKAASHIRARSQPEKYGARRLIEGPDVCRVCGKATPPRSRRRARTCERQPCVDAYAQRGFHNFLRAVDSPHPLKWLGPKLGLAVDDPRLAGIAIAFALKGKLVVYVRIDGSIGEIGRPRDERASAA